MARFDVYRSREGGDLWLDCQADRLSHLQQRFVVPLVPPPDAPSPRMLGLNPSLKVNGVEHVMLTQFAGAVAVSALGHVVAKLGDDDHRIIDALDVLIGAA